MLYSPLKSPLASSLRSVTDGAMRPTPTELMQSIYAAYRAAGAVIVQQDVQDQWEHQQRMLSLYPGDNSKLVLFQDSALTTPVTAVGQLIGARLDLETAGSWNGTDAVTAIPGCHMIQATDTKRPPLVSSGASVALDYDGSNDFMLSASSLNLSATDALTIFAAVEKDTDATGIILEHGQNTTQAFMLYVRTGGYDWYSRGTLTAPANSISGFPAPARHVLTALADISDDKCEAYINGVRRTFSTADQGTGNYTSRVLYEGARLGTSLFFNGRCRGFTLLGANLTDAQRGVIERRINQKWGAY